MFTSILDVHFLSCSNKIETDAYFVKKRIERFPLRSDLVFILEVKIRIEKFRLGLPNEKLI